MYLEHFRLKEAPFGITPDTDFFFSSTPSQEALNTLLVATRSGEGFIKITGEVGTGKTLLCRQLLMNLGDEFQTAYIPNPLMEPMTLLLELANELGASTQYLPVTPKAQQQHVLLKSLQDRLLELAQEGKRVLVCLDEAQALPIKTLEALRLLSNLETEKRKLLQVVIFGQPELDDKLSDKSIRQLKQRITFEYHLRPLNSAEMAAYLTHRLTVAGYVGPPLFSALALKLLRWRTGGTPRLVNIVAHKSLMSAYGRGAWQAGLRDVLSAVGDTASVRMRLGRLAFGGLVATGALFTMGMGLARIV